MAVCFRWQEWAIFAAEQERERRILELRLIEEVGHLYKHYIHIFYIFIYTRHLEMKSLHA
jgi:hypothetical protein